MDMKKYESLDDVMKELTRYKNTTNNYDIFNDRINTIADMLELFEIKWQYVEENERFIAKLL